MNRPDSNGTVMDHLIKKYADKSGKLYFNDVEYHILLDVFGIKWAGGFREDTLEILELAEKLVDACKLDLYNRDQEELEGNYND
jgi:hypothetical protein